MRFLTALSALLLLCMAAGCRDSNNSAPVTSPSPTPTTSGPGTPVSIVFGASTMTSTAFAPNPVTVAVGGTVTWANNDSTTHTSTSDSGAWNSGSIVPGGTFTRTFSTAGTFTYHCSIHPNIVGTVTVQ